MWIGILYEALTLVELWDGRLEAAVEAFEQARSEYVRCPASGLAVRLEALRQQLLDAGVVPPRSADIGTQEPDAIGRSTSAPATLISQALDRCRDAAARAQGGLSLLCSQAGAVDGHLFLLQGSELELVASLGDRPPSQGLRELAQARVTLQDDDQMTVAVALTSVPPPDPATLGFRVQGLNEADTREYASLCIRADLGGESALIGVATLGFVGPIELRPKVLALANAFGDYLLRSGTSVSVTAKSGMCTREL